MEQKTSLTALTLMFAATLQHPEFLFDNTPSLKLKTPPDLPLETKERLKQEALEKARLKRSRKSQKRLSEMKKK